MTKIIQNPPGSDAIQQAAKKAELPGGKAVPGVTNDPRQGTIVNKDTGTVQSAAEAAAGAQGTPTTGIQTAPGATPVPVAPENAPVEGVNIKAQAPGAVVGDGTEGEPRGPDGKLIPEVAGSEAQRVAEKTAARTAAADPKGLPTINWQDPGRMTRAVRAWMEDKHGYKAPELPEGSELPTEKEAEAARANTDRHFLDAYKKTLYSYGFNNLADDLDARVFTDEMLRELKPYYDAEKPTNKPLTEAERAKAAEAKAAAQADAAAPSIGRTENLEEIDEDEDDEGEGEDDYTDEDEDEDGEDDEAEDGTEEGENKPKKEKVIRTRGLTGKKKKKSGKK